MIGAVRKHKKVNEQQTIGRKKIKVTESQRRIKELKSKGKLKNSGTVKNGR